MRALFALLIASTILTACDGGNKKNNSKNKLQKAIIGSWEMTSATLDETTVNFTRPNTDKPFQELENQGHWQQLHITKDKITMLFTDNFITYTSIGGEYQLKGNKIVTTDTDSTDLTDFVVHSYSKNSLIVSYDDGVEDPVSDRVRYTFTRIGDKKLASRSALSINFESSIRIKTQDNDGSDLLIDEKAKSDSNTFQEGPNNTLECSVSDDGALDFSFAVLTRSEDSFSWSGGNQYAWMNFKNVELDLSKSQESHSNLNVEADGSAGFIGHRYKNLDGSKCELTLMRNGAILDLVATCRNSNQPEVSIDVTCLLEKHY